jgi:ComF family protein
MRFLENLIQSVSAQVLPSACIVCQRFQVAPICANCLQQLNENGLLHYECCNQCGIPLNTQELLDQRCNQCQKNSPFFDKTICLERYHGCLQEPLHQFKYQKRITYAHAFAYAWNQIQARHIDQEQIDYLVPVPLSQEKLIARGFNQSWEIARRIHCDTSIKRVPWALKRHHHPVHQAGTNKHGRRDTVREMFYIERSHRELFENKSVVVFDDVMTTGATLNEIARVLKGNGVTRVLNWVLLRTTQFH